MNGYQIPSLHPALADVQRICGTVSLVDCLDPSGYLVKSLLADADKLDTAFIEL